MNDQSWQIIEHVFNVAIDLPAAQRQAYLETACLDDQIRAEVESLIEAEERSKTYFESRIAAAAQDAVAERDKDKQPKKRKQDDRIGAYRLLRSLGNDTHLAEGDDGLRVALRVLPGPDTTVALERVRAEIGLLERLRHPNVASILGGGETKRAPFVVLELVEGESLEEYCDSRQLSLEARIGLFQQVCQAVHYAHRSLALHGNLEPANVLVTGDGTPKLVNFGLSRLQAYAADRTIPRRSSDSASPEELRREPPTAASEIYSLGVMLYRLLVGRPPYDLSSSSTVEIERIVCELETPRPSAYARAEPGAAAISRKRGLTPEKLEHRVRGDLDRIVMRAMRQAPAERYESAAHLSDELTAFLEGRPVRARGLGWPYHFGKFVRRHWQASAVAASLLAALAGLALWGGFAAFRGSNELAAAEKARAEAELVSGFLTDIYSVADPREGRGSSVTAREVLDWGAARIARELNDRPEDQAALMAALSDAYARLGLFQQAGDQAAAALAKRKGALGDEHPAVAESLRRLGRLETLRGSPAGAAAYFLQALEMDRAVNNDEDAVASDLDGLAAALRDQDELDEAERRAREAVELRRRALDKGRLELAASLRVWASILRRQERYDEAEGSMREALDVLRTGAGDLHPEAADASGELGAILREAGRYEQAEEALAKALSSTLEIHGERHPAAADSLRSLAQVLGKRGRPNEAREMLQVALDVDQTALGPDHLEVAADLSALGELARQGGDASGAEEHFRRALEIRTARLGPDDPLRADSMLSLGSLLADGETASEGQLLLQEAVRIMRQTLAATHPRIAEAENALAQSLARQQRYRDAERVLVSGPAAEGVDEENRRRALKTLESVYRAWGRAEDADRTAKTLAGLP
jgi:serine/threonine-protein kinase